MSWFYLALLAPLLYAIVNLFDDNLLKFVYKGPYLATTFAGLFGTLPLLSLFFLHFSSISLGLSLLAEIAGFLTVVYLFFYFRGLESDTPSIVVALFSFAPVTIPFFAYFINNERLSFYEIIGFIIVLFSMLFLTAIDIKKLKFSKALIPILIAVFFVDIISIDTKYVYQHVSFYPAFMAFSAGMGLGGLTFFLMKYKRNISDFKDIKKSLVKLLPVFLLVQIFAIAADFTLNLAISRGPVSLVKVIEGIQPIFVLLIAIILYPIKPKYFREAESEKPLKKIGLMFISIIGLVIIIVTSKK